MRHNEIFSAATCAFIMFSCGNETNQQRDVSQLCAVFMVNALAPLIMFGVLLNEMPALIRDMLKSIDSSAKDSREYAFAIAHHPSKLRRYKFLAQMNNDLSVGIRQLINQNKRGTEA